MGFAALRLVKIGAVGHLLWRGICIYIISKIQMMRSVVEKADVSLLYQLKDQKRRFIILAPYQNPIALTNESGKTVLTLNYYDALITARAHSSTLKGKYAFIFDLENKNHLYKLEQLLAGDSLYDIYVDPDAFNRNKEPLASFQ